MSRVGELGGRFQITDDNTKQCCRVNDYPGLNADEVQFFSFDKGDVELYLVLLGDPSPPRTIRLVGCELKYLNPDERSTGALIRNALMKKPDSQNGGEIQSTPGIHISMESFKDTLEKLAKISSLFYLKEDGEPFSVNKNSKDITFILSDDKNMTQEEEQEILKLNPEIISLGQKSYHSDHCITVVNWMMDCEYQ